MHFEHTTHQGARECASRSRGTRDELRVRWDGSETAVDTFARASRRELWCAGYSNCPASPPPFGTQPSPQTLMLPPLSLGVGVHIHVKPSTKLYLLIVNNPSHEPCRLCCEGARRERERERERRVREGGGASTCTPLPLPPPPTWLFPPSRFQYGTERRTERRVKDQSIAL